MQRKSVEALVGALNKEDVRYLVVGGLAVVAHGYVRFTADVDIILDFEQANLGRAVVALTRLGYRPRAPVRFEEFLDPAARARWVRDKGLTVFALYSAEHPATEVDLFVEPPFDFEEAYARRTSMEIAAGVVATFVGLDDLLEMKSRTGRAQDALDVERLTRLRKDESDEG